MRILLETTIEKDDCRTTIKINGRGTPWDFIVGINNAIYSLSTLMDKKITKSAEEKYHDTNLNKKLGIKKGD